MRKAKLHYQSLSSLKCGSLFFFSPWYCKENNLPLGRMYVKGYVFHRGIFRYYACYYADGNYLNVLYVFGNTSVTKEFFA